MLTNNCCYSYFFKTEPDTVRLVKTGEFIPNDSWVCRILDLDMSNEKGHIAAAGADQKLKILDAANGNLLQEFKDSLFPYISVEYSPSGKFLAYKIGRAHV